MTQGWDVNCSLYFTVWVQVPTGHVIFFFFFESLNVLKDEGKTTVSKNSKEGLQSRTHENEDPRISIVSTIWTCTTETLVDVGTGPGVTGVYGLPLKATPYPMCE